MKPPFYSVAFILMGAVALAPEPAAGSCRQAPSLDDKETFPGEPYVNGASDGLPLTVATGKLSIEDDNSLVPTFNSDCGAHVAASLANDRLQLEFAGPSPGLSLEQTETDSQNGIAGYANLSADLTAPTSPLALSLEASFFSDAGDGSDPDRRYLAGRSWIGLFDERLEASAEVALSLDNGEDKAGFATKYEISAGIWQTDDFSLSSFAGLAFADPDYDADDSDAIADRLIREFGASMNWGRMNLSLLNSLATDNVDHKDDGASSQWTTWDAELGVDLSNLHPFIPNSVSVGFEFERFNGLGGGTSVETARGQSRSIDLDLGWTHHGGTTTLGVSQSIEWEQTTPTDEVDESELEIGLGRSITADSWNLSAEGTFTQDLVNENQQAHRYRTVGFDVELTIDPSPYESLGVDAGLVFDEGYEGRSLTFGEASFLFTYELRF